MGKVNVGLSIIVVNDNKVLLGKRAEGGELGGYSWNTPGGKLEEGEKILDGAVRELAEETGIKVSSDELKPIGVIESKITKHYITFVFLLELNKAVSPVTNEEVSHWGWFDLDKLPNELYPPTRDAIALYRKYLSEGKAVFQLLK